jgi:hypothetical protein
MMILRKERKHPPLHRHCIQPIPPA